jgi:hypothetical protein
VLGGGPLGEQRLKHPHGTRTTPLYSPISTPNSTACRSARNAANFPRPITWPGAPRPLGSRGMAIFQAAYQSRIAGLSRGVFRSIGSLGALNRLRFRVVAVVNLPSVWRWLRRVHPHFEMQCSFAICHVRQLHTLP